MNAEIIINKNYERINPVLFGYQTCENSHHYGPAIRPYWLFHFIVSGKGSFHIGGREYALSKGMMFVIPPFVQTYYEADAEDPWEYIWVGFTGQPPLELKDIYHIPKALRIFEHMKACHSLREGKTEFILAKLWELFSLLLEGTQLRSDPIDMVLNLIHTEYMTPLTVGQMAQLVHLDRAYFSGLFCKRTGISPRQYLIQHRMTQAKSLLTEGHSVTVTANSVGYPDIFSFSKMFKRYFGHAPSYYQRKDGSDEKEVQD